MKLVVIANESPWPSNHGGRIRIAQVLQVFGSHHEVYLAAPSGQDFQAPDFIAGSIRLVKQASSRNKFSFRPKLGADLLGHNQARLREFIDQVQPDLIYWTHSYLPAGAPELFAEFAHISFVEFANIEGERFASMAKSQKMRGKFRLMLESLKAKIWEPKVARKAKAAVALSEKDACRLSEWDANVLLAPNGVNYQPLATTGSDAYLLIFASMNYAPNIESTLDFVENFWPKVSAVFPDLELVVAGRSANKLNLMESVNLRIVSDPESQEAIYQGALASVIPTTSGGGSQLKITESLQRNRLCLISPYTLSTAPPELSGYLSKFTFSNADELIEKLKPLQNLQIRAQQELAIEGELRTLSWENAMDQVLVELTKLSTSKN